MLDSLDADVLATSSQATLAAQLRTWANLHARWYGSGDDAPPVWPLTVEHIRAITAQLKAAHYRSAPNYLSAAKRRHLELSMPWTDDLSFAHRDCLASTQRGIGAPRQTAELEILAVHALNLGPDPLVDDGPVCPGEWAIMATFHLMRGAESSAANHRDLTFDIDACTECLTLPVSKTDQLAAGVRRTWGCVCVAPDTPSGPCPFHAASRLADELSERFCNDEGFVPGSTPLFPTSGGSRCTRLGFVKTVEAIASLLKVDLKDEWGRCVFGEHVWRISGARHCHRMAIDVPTIMRLARWGSDVILRYLADSVLTTLTARYRSHVARAHAVDLTQVTERDVERIIASRFQLAAAEHGTTTAALASMSDAVAALSSQVTQLDLSLHPKYATHAKSGKYHALRGDDGPDQAQQRTLCGISAMNLSRRTALPENAQVLKCFNCFGV